MIARSFQLTLLRLFSMLGVVYNDSSYVFGPNYKLKILEFELDDIVYVSRSRYKSNLKEYEDQIYRGRNIKTPEKESELIELLLLSPINKPENKTIIVEMTNRTVGAVCSRCKGKGFMDWVEETLHEESKHYVQKDLDFTYNKMLLSYTIFYGECHTLFYRRRNMNNKYIKDCKLCSRCEGVGFEYEFLKEHIPDQFDVPLSSISKYIESERIAVNP